MKQYGIYFDAERCVQCYACEVACKSMNGVEPGVKWRMVFDVWKGQFPQVLNQSVSHGCQHCAKPVCAEACPTGAIQKRLSDGIVLVDEHKCIGCHTCQLVCPFGIPQFGGDGRMQKCNLCLDRVERGQEPACVATCPAEALHFGPQEELNELVAKKAAQKLAMISASAEK